MDLDDDDDNHHDDDVCEDENEDEHEAVPARDVDVAAAGPAGDSGKRLTKSELFRAYKSLGPHRMYCDIMCDSDLRGAAEILTRVAYPLHAQYRHDLVCQKQGLESMLEWCAQRALASTQATVIEIFRVQSSKELFKGLRLPYCNPPRPYDETHSDDIALTEKAARFSTHLAANYGWGEMLHYYTLPLAATSLIAQNVEDRERGMRHLKRVIDAIIKAEEMVHTNPSIQPLLRDIAFVEETLAREIMILLKRAEFSLDTDSAREVQAAMVKFNSGSSSTKEILESTFAHLSYCVSASNKNKVVSPSLLWLYCSGSPYVAESGMKQVVPSKRDWLQNIANYGQAKSEQMKRFNASFKASTTPLPSAPDMAFPKSVDGLAKSKWRLAGPASHYKSSAAVAFLVNDAKHDFKNCSSAWLGGAI